MRALFQKIVILRPIPSNNAQIMRKSFQDECDPLRRILFSAILLTYPPRPLLDQALYHPNPFLKGIQDQASHRQ